VTLRHLSPRHGASSRRRRARSGRVCHPFAPLQSRLKFTLPPPATPAVPRPSPSGTPAAAASPTLHGLDMPRCIALCRAAHRCGGRPQGPRHRGCGCPSMLPLLASPRAYVFLPYILWALGQLVPLGLAASCGVGTQRLQRPSLRARANTRHPSLSAAFDAGWKTGGRRPHLSDGCFSSPELQRAASTSTKANA
jgi:hypothetical protein